MELVGTRKTVYVALRTLLAFVLALILGGIVFFAAGFNPVQVYKLIFLGAFGLRRGHFDHPELCHASDLYRPGLRLCPARQGHEAWARRASSMSAPGWPLSSGGYLPPPAPDALRSSDSGGQLPVRRMLCRYRRLSEQPVRRQYGHRHSDAKLCGPAVLQLSGQQCVCG